jgi:hypothetical protein
MRLSVILQNAATGEIHQSERGLGIGVPFLSRQHVKYVDNPDGTRKGYPGLALFFSFS